MAAPSYDDVARHVIVVAKLCVQKEAQIGYTQGASRWSGIDRHITHPNVPPWADCSAFTSWLFWEARLHVRGTPGIDIVNGQRWQAGFTGTQILHGARHKHGRELYKPGRTLLFYGGPINGTAPTHVTLWIGNDRVISHGNSTGPKELDWDYRTDFRLAKAYGI